MKSINDYTRSKSSHPSSFRPGLMARLMPIPVAVAAAVLAAASPGPVEARGFFGEAVKWVGHRTGLKPVSKMGQELDNANRDIKKELSIYQEFEEKVLSRPVRKGVRWIEKHPTEAIAIALVAATAGAACADGCSLLLSVSLAADSAASAAGAIAIPIGIVAADEKDRQENTRQRQPSESQPHSTPIVVRQEAPAKDTRSDKHAVPRYTLGFKAPIHGKYALYNDGPIYTVVPGRNAYRALYTWERFELTTNRDIAKKMGAADFVHHVWPRNACFGLPKCGVWDYKRQPGWGPGSAEFGNINYGFIGKSVADGAFSDEMLFAGAGAAQQFAPGSGQLYDPKHGSFLDLLDPRTRGGSLYGDLPEDRRAIESGITMNKNWELIRFLEGDAPILSFEPAQAIPPGR